MATMAPPVSEMSRSEIVRLIDREAKLLGLSGEAAIAHVHRGETGTNYLWRDISSLVFLLNE